MRKTVGTAVIKGFNYYQNWEKGCMTGRKRVDYNPGKSHRGIKQGEKRVNNLRSDHSYRKFALYFLRGTGRGD